jgi:hypothetical protein
MLKAHHSTGLLRAPEGIRTPNLLIRSNSIDPTRAEAARPQTKPGQVFAQVKGVRTRDGGPSRSVTELRSRGILGHILGHRGRLRPKPGGGRYAPAVEVTVNLEPWVRRRCDAPHAALMPMSGRRLAWRFERVGNSRTGALLVAIVSVSV